MTEEQIKELQNKVTELEKKNNELQQQISATDNSIAVIKEECEAKIKAVEEEKEKALKDSEDRHNNQIRALMRGDNNVPQPSQELNFEEEMLQELRNKNNLK